MTETINWQTMPDKDKIRLIITDVLQWQCYESSSEYHKRTDRDGTAAYWDDQPYGHSRWSVGYEPFNPLHRMQDAWQIVEHLRKNQFDTHVAVAPFQYEVSIMDRRFGGQHHTASAKSAPEAICVAALRTQGHIIEGVPQ